MPLKTLHWDSGGALVTVKSKNKNGYFLRIKVYILKHVLEQSVFFTAEDDIRLFCYNHN